MVTERQFQFHGSQIGRAKSAFEAGGFMPYIYPAGGGMYLIVVALPDNIGEVDWQTLDGWQNKGRSRRRWAKTITKAGIVLAIIAAVAVGGYYGIQAAGSVGGQLGDAWGEFTSNLPWSEPEQPKVAPKPTPAPKPADFFGIPLPELKLFDSAEPAPAKEEKTWADQLVDPITKPIDELKNTVSMIFNIFIGLCVLIVLFMARGVIGAIFSGVAGVVSVAGSLAGKGKK